MAIVLICFVSLVIATVLVVKKAFSKFDQKFEEDWQKRREKIAQYNRVLQDGPRVIEVTTSKKRHKPLVVCAVEGSSKRQVEDVLSRGSYVVDWNLNETSKAGCRLRGVPVLELDQVESTLIDSQVNYNQIRSQRALGLKKSQKLKDNIYFN